MFTSSLVVYFVLKTLSKEKARSEEKDYLQTISVNPTKDETRKKKASRPECNLSPRQHKTLLELGKYSSLVFLCLAGIIEPSLSNSIYFLCFLAFSTWLACNRELRYKFGIMLKIISIALIIHFSLIILYQFPCIQKAVRSDSLTARIAGLRPFFKNNLQFNWKMNWDHYLNPLVLIIAYFVICSTSSFILVRLHFIQEFI